MPDGYYFCKTCNRFYEVGSLRFLLLHNRKHEMFYRGINDCPADNIHEHTYENCALKYR